MAIDDAEQLLGEVEALRSAVVEEAATIAKGWEGWIARPAFAPSADNLAHYLALRRRDIRPLQHALMARGLSSLGRAEGRVMPALDAVAGILSVLAGRSVGMPDIDPNFFAGEERLLARTTELLAPGAQRRPVRLLITTPSEAADDGGYFMTRLAELGVEAVRINCAHDDVDAWARMIEGVDLAAAKTGRRMKVLMDLAGPKIRTGEIRKHKDGKRVGLGNLLAIAAPGQLGAVDKTLPAVECTLPEAIGAARIGQRIFIDDGKLETEVTRVEPWGVVVEVKAGPDEDGYKLKSEKGINFPETDFSVPALTSKDIEDLAFVALHADGIEFSFVQREEDIVALQQALARLRPDWQKLGLVLKIETVRAVANLPAMLVRAAGSQPTAMMIARGDLAVELGFGRLAEMQEELLWLGEAAQIPVIWATQVLESFIKSGVPSRGEMTDAAMSARAECVMLNKGPFLFEAIAELDLLLGRMGEHTHKKTPQLRRLTSW